MKNIFLKIFLEFFKTIFLKSILENNFWNLLKNWSIFNKETTIELIWSQNLLNFEIDNY